jgi:integrase
VELPPDRDGKRNQKYVYADKRQDCQRLVNELVYQLESSDFADAGRLTMEAYLEEWYKTYSVKLARTIGIPADLLAALEQKKSVGYVAGRDGRETHISNYSDRFAKFLKRNGLPHIRFHDLRHFHATLMLEAGLDLRFVQSRLGHSNISMAAHYQHILPKADKGVVEKIDGYLRGSKCGSNAKPQQKS